MGMSRINHRGAYAPIGSINVESRVLKPDRGKQLPVGTVPGVVHPLTRAWDPRRAAPDPPPR